ncbi:transmembrane protein 35B [Bombina bombina]|uniref:transmembrane protein 35B n=1 Tax=Bombina bombina TaxID=8345 RepID=UPI00235B2021|nr:transmembrane protein 35B [Bombina bombina]
MAFSIFTILRLILGLFFAVTGAVKLTDQISADVYKQMKHEFVLFADVFPLKDFGVKPEPEEYMLICGCIELVAGILLAFGPQILQEISNFVLCIVMIGAIYSLLVLKEPLAHCAPATVCLGLLFLISIRGRGRKIKSKGE